MNRWFVLTLVTLSLAAVGCGQGGAGGVNPIAPTPPPVTNTKIIKFQASSLGANNGTSAVYGYAKFSRNGEELSFSDSRGFNIVAFSPTTGQLVQPPQGFDTYLTSNSLSEVDAWQAMINFLNSLPDKTLILIAVEDEAGLTSGAYGGCFASTPFAPDNPCSQPLHSLDADNGRQLLQQLGSTMIQNYSYRNAWSMITVKGQGKQDESLQVTGPATTNYTLTLP